MWRENRKRKLDHGVRSEPELEFMKTSFDFKSTIAGYQKTVLSFGYMTMFVSALPGAAFAVFVS